MPWIGGGQGGHNVQDFGGWRGNTFTLQPPALRRRERVIAAFPQRQQQAVIL